MKVPFKVKRVVAIAFMLMVSMAWLSCSDWEVAKVIKQPSPKDSTDSLTSLEKIDISGSMQGVDFFKLFAGKKNIVFMDGDDTIGMVLNMGENTHYIYKENELDIKTVTYTSKDNMGVVVVSAKNAIITAYTPKLEGVYIAMFNKSNNKDADTIKEKRDVSGTEEEKLHLSGYWFNGDNTVFKVKPNANAKPSASECKTGNTSSAPTPSLLDMVYTPPGTDPNIFSDASASGSSSTSSDDAPPSEGYVPSWGTKRWVQNEDQNRMMEILLGVSNDYIALSQDADLTSYPSGVVNGQFYCYTNPSNGVKKFYVISEMAYDFIGPHSWPGINSIAKLGQVYVYANTYTGATDYFVAKKRINTDWFPTNQTSNSSWEYVTTVRPGTLTEAEYLLVYDLFSGKTTNYETIEQSSTVNLVKDRIYQIVDNSVSYKKFYQALQSSPRSDGTYIRLDDQVNFKFLGPYGWPGLNGITKSGQVYVFNNTENGSIDYFVAKKNVNTDWFPTDQTSNSSWGYMTNVFPTGQTEAEYLLMYDLLSGKNTDYQTIEQRTVVNLVKDRIYQIVDNRVPYKKFYKALRNWRTTSVSLNDAANLRFLGPYEWPGKDVAGIGNGIYMSYSEISGRVDYWRLRKSINRDWYSKSKVNSSSWAYVGTDNSQFFIPDAATSKIADHVMLREKGKLRDWKATSVPNVLGDVYYSWTKDRNDSWYRQYWQIAYDEVKSEYCYKFMGPMMLYDMITTDFSPTLRGQVGSVFRRYNPSTKKAAYFKLSVNNITQGIPMDKSNNETWEYIGEEDDISILTVKEYTVTSNYVSHEASWSWNNFISTMESLDATRTITFVRSVQTDWDISGTIETKLTAFRERLRQTYTQPEANTIYTLVCWSPPVSSANGQSSGNTYRFDALVNASTDDVKIEAWPCSVYKTIDAGYVVGAHELGHVLGAEHNSQQYFFYYEIMHPHLPGRTVHRLESNRLTMKRNLGIAKFY